MENKLEPPSPSALHGYAISPAEKNVEVSVVICSYNRSESLGKTLSSIMKMTGLGDLEWEVVIVDNDSEDDTREVVERYRRSCWFPVRYFVEKKRGLSFARNRGLMEARGKIVAFTDDDVIVDENWVRNIANAFRKYDTVCIGGKILPIWEKPEPKWLSENLHPFLALLDYGDEPFYLETPKIWGANFIIEAGICRSYGSFSTERGRVPGKLYSGEETDLCRKLLDGNEKVMYVPDIIVHHRIPEPRMKKMYFRRWLYYQGELAGILLGEYSDRHILGIPLYFFRKLITDVFSFCTARTSQTRFSYELRVIDTIGMLAGRLKRRRGQDAASSIGER